MDSITISNMTDVIHFEIDENRIARKIVAALIWILLQFPCNVLLFGFVQFDRLGGDPLKRRITDQVLFINRKRNADL